MAAAGRQTKLDDLKVDSSRAVVLVSWRYPSIGLESKLNGSWLCREPEPLYYSPNTATILTEFARFSRNYTRSFKDGQISGSIEKLSCSLFYARVNRLRLVSARIYSENNRSLAPYYWDTANGLDAIPPGMDMCVCARKLEFVMIFKVDAWRELLRCLAVLGTVSWVSRAITKYWSIILVMA